jgi:hypothetical protein
MAVAICGRERKAPFETLSKQSLTDDNIQRSGRFDLVD